MRETHAEYVRLKIGPNPVSPVPAPLSCVIPSGVNHGRSPPATHIEGLFGSWGWDPTTRPPPAGAWPRAPSARDAGCGPAPGGPARRGAPPPLHIAPTAIPWPHPQRSLVTGKATTQKRLGDRSDMSRFTKQNQPKKSRPMQNLLGFRSDPIPHDAPPRSHSCAATSGFLFLWPRSAPTVAAGSTFPAPWWGTEQSTRPGNAVR